MREGSQSVHGGATGSTARLAGALLSGLLALAAGFVSASPAFAGTGQSITVTSTAPSPGLTGTSYTPTATASSGLAVAITVDAASAANCSITNGVVTFFDAAGSTCQIDFNQAGNGSYNAASQVTQTVSIAHLSSSTQGQTSLTITPLTAGPQSVSTWTTNGSNGYSPTVNEYFNDEKFEVKGGGFEANTTVQVIECANPSGTSATLPHDNTTCDGNTELTANTNGNGFLDFTVGGGYISYSLPSGSSASRQRMADLRSQRPLHLLRRRELQQAGRGSAHLLHLLPALRRQRPTACRRTAAHHLHEHSAPTNRVPGNTYTPTATSSSGRT